MTHFNDETTSDIVLKFFEIQIKLLISKMVQQIFNTTSRSNANRNLMKFQTTNSFFENLLIAFLISFKSNDKKIVYRKSKTMKRNSSISVH